MLTQSIGARAEQAALNYLATQGLRLLEKNFYCKLGEIDLIMIEAQTVVFVEVRYRKQTEYGHASDSITYRKQQKIIRAAQVFLLRNQHLKHQPCRFDVVTLERSGTTRAKIQWLKSAFTC